MWASFTLYDSRGHPTGKSSSSLICHRSRARGTQSGSPPLSVTKKGLYVGRYPHSCTISCGLLQELSITGRFFWFICAHPRKRTLAPFLSPFHSKLCRPSYFRAGIPALSHFCHQGPIFVTVTRLLVPRLSLLIPFLSLRRAALYKEEERGKEIIWGSSIVRKKVNRSRRTRVPSNACRRAKI